MEFLDVFYLNCNESCIVIGSRAGNFLSLTCDMKFIQPSQSDALITKTQNCQVLESSHAKIKEVSEKDASSKVHKSSAFEEAKASIMENTKIEEKMTSIVCELTDRFSESASSTDAKALSNRTESQKRKENNTSQPKKSGKHLYCDHTLQSEEDPSSLDQSRVSKFEETHTSEESFVQQLEIVTNLLASWEFGKEISSLCTFKNSINDSENAHLIGIVGTLCGEIIVLGIGGGLPCTSNIQLPE